MVRDAYLLFFLSKIAEKPLLPFQIHAVNYYKLCALNDSSSVVITSPYFGGNHIFILTAFYANAVGLWWIYSEFISVFAKNTLQSYQAISGHSLFTIEFPAPGKLYIQQVIKLQVKIWTSCHITPINVVISNIRWFIFNIIRCTYEKWIVAKRQLNPVIKTLYKIDGLVQYFSNTSMLTMELLQSYATLSIWQLHTCKQPVL